MAEETARCTCGKLVKFYSSLLDQGFCSDDCYCKARGYIERPVFKHDQFEEAE